MAHIYPGAYVYTPTEGGPDSKTKKRFHPKLEKYRNELDNIEISIERIEEILNSPGKKYEKLEKELLPNLRTSLKNLENTDFFENSRYELNIKKITSDIDYLRRKKNKDISSKKKDWENLGYLIGGISSVPTGIIVYIVSGYDLFWPFVAWGSHFFIGGISGAFLGEYIGLKRYLKNYENYLIKYSKSLADNSKKFLDGLRMK